jgi:hypothetical protein
MAVWLAIGIIAKNVCVPVTKTGTLRHSPQLISSCDADNQIEGRRELDSDIVGQTSVTYVRQRHEDST